MFVIALCLSLTEGVIGLSCTSGMDGSIIFQKRDTTEKSCVLPDPPQNGNYTMFLEPCPVLTGDCWAPPGSLVPHTKSVTVTCNPGYFIKELESDSLDIYCYSGRWNETFPYCKKKECGYDEEASSLYRQGYPWSAIIIHRLEENGPWNKRCLGTLITSTIVLTAAPCNTMGGTTPFNGPMQVGVGININNTYANYIQVKKLVFHPNFTSTNVSTKYDIAIVHLLIQVVLSSHVMPACVDWSHLYKNLQYNREKIYTVGFNNSATTVIRYTGKYTDRSTCRELLLHYRSYITEEKFCVLKDDLSICEMSNCSEYRNATQISSKQDHGSGLTFISKDGRHFFVGMMVGLLANKGMETLLMSSIYHPENIAWLIKETELIKSEDILKCVLPEPPQHGNYTWLFYRQSCSGRSSTKAICWSQPGVIRAQHNNVISVFCNPGYQLKDYTSEYVHIRCDKGQWTQNIPQCENITVAGMCGRLVSFSLDITCRHADREVSCKNFVPAGTVATAKCREHFTWPEGTEQSNLLCQDNGQWNQSLVECDPPDCGIPLSPAAYESPGLQQRAYPWTVFIYMNLGEKSTSMFGTLITPKVVLTKSNILGRTTNKYMEVHVGLADNKYKAFQVQEIVVHRNYKKIFYYMIGLIILAEPVTVSALIMPVCFDWTNSLNLGSRNTGYIIGLNNSLYHTIFSYEVKYSSLSSCRSLMEGYKVKDKVVCVNENQDYNICNGSYCFKDLKLGPRNTEMDFGAVLTAEKNGKHFFVGIQTMRLKLTDIFSTLLYPGQMDWLRKQLDTIRLKCAVPDPSDNRIFTKDNPYQYCLNNVSICNYIPKEEVSEEKFTVSCSPGYVMVFGVDTVVSEYKLSLFCSNGKWNPAPPVCYKMCPPLIHSTLDLRCRHGTTQVNCEQPMLPNSLATFSCKSYNDKSGNHEGNRLRCLFDGSWSGELHNCTQQCGISNLDNTDVQPTILGGSYVRPGNVPWHAALYFRIEEHVWENKCGGTLVSTRHVLTAAHCVTLTCYTCKPPPQPAADVMVGLGRIYRVFNSTEGITRKVVLIHIHPNYFGPSLNHQHDIAVLLLDSQIAVNRYVMPACVDFSLSYLKGLLQNKTQPGYVAGWGNTEECSSKGNVCFTPSEKLKLTKTTIVEFEKCFEVSQSSRPAFQSRLSLDKFCEGNGTVSAIQQGDSGGGLTFVFGGRHYIHGVVSVKVKLELQDKLYYNFGAFTNVSDHLDWLGTIL